MDIPIYPTILLVDDDNTMAGILTKFVEHLAPNYPIQRCRDGYEALAYVAQHTVACVITDYIMPTMDGITLCEILTDTWPSIPVLLLSGQSAKTVQRQLKEQSTKFVAVLEKPFRIGDLQQALSLALSSYTASDTPCHSIAEPVG